MLKTVFNLENTIAQNKYKMHTILCLNSLAKTIYLLQMVIIVIIRQEIKTLRPNAPLNIEYMKFAFYYFLYKH